MSDLTKREQSAIEAVARRFSATWEESSDSGDACIRLSGKRIAVETATLQGRGKKQGKEAKPHLRFDREVVRLMEQLGAAFDKTVPDGVSVALTVTAPIQLASQTAAVLEAKIPNLLKRRSWDRDEKSAIHGNRVRIRRLRSKWKRAPKLIGFVHNPDSHAAILLLNMTAELLEFAVAQTGRQPRKSGGDRWLVVTSGRASSCAGAYRCIFSQLGMSPNFKKALIVFGDGRVEELLG